MVGLSSTRKVSRAMAQRIPGDSCGQCTQGGQDVRRPVVGPPCRLSRILPTADAAAVQRLKAAGAASPAPPPDQYTPKSLSRMMTLMGTPSSQRTMDFMGVSVGGWDGHHDRQRHGHRRAGVRGLGP